MKKIELNLVIESDRLLKKVKRHAKMFMLCPDVPLYKFKIRKYGALYRNNKNVDTYKGVYIKTNKFV